jgi:hypothetical protein
MVGDKSADKPKTQFAYVPNLLDDIKRKVKWRVAAACATPDLTGGACLTGCIVWWILLGGRLLGAWQRRLSDSRP